MYLRGSIPKRHSFSVATLGRERHQSVWMEQDKAPCSFFLQGERLSLHSSLPR